MGKEVGLITEAKLVLGRRKCSVCWEIAVWGWVWMPFSGGCVGCLCGVLWFEVPDTFSSWVDRRRLRWDAKKELEDLGLPVAFLQPLTQ
jgi:hypothetical protein